jgi:hypothetical protein
MKDETCEICKRSFFTKPDLEAHKAYSHAGIATVYCHICGDKFSSKNNLRMHERWKHSSERPIPCEFPDCERRFICGSDMRAHVRKTHTNLSLQCQFCPKVFKSQSSFRVHQRFHDESAQLVCDFVNPETNQPCGKRYVTSNSLKEHIECFHQGTKRFVCSHCEVAGFNTKMDLQVHILNVHENRRIQCELCDRQLTARNYYNRHIKEKHPELDEDERNAILEKIKKLKVDKLFNAVKH